MKTVLFIAPLLAAIATALPTSIGSGLSGSQMIQYCASTNMEGNCTYLDDSVVKNCVLTAHDTMSIKVFDGYECSLYFGGCSPSGHKNWKAGTYNTIDGFWNASRAIDCWVY
ncbi:hypothetical protein PG994_008382 [Apiospora phragmitis]|uniref:Uncharacterized protein n=1 Tax=Apiospora phragmitis TaxID=2905665 RepID=A0ABR1UVB4_9PEZI